MEIWSYLQKMVEAEILSPVWCADALKSWTDMAPRMDIEFH